MAKKKKPGVQADPRLPPQLPNNTVGPHVYRGQQFKSDAYRDWIRQAVKPIKYDKDTNVLPHAGTRSAPQQPEVYLMTHGAPHKLPAMRRMLKLWNGPAAIAVLIPLPKKHPGAARCRTNVLSYMRDTLDQLPPPWTDVPGSAAVNLTLLYSAAISSNLDISCALPATASGLEKLQLNESLWRSQFEGKPYLDIFDAEYPTGELRQAALDLVPDDAFAFLADPGFVFPTNFASGIVEEEMGALLRYAADTWHARGERHAVIVPALQRLPNVRSPPGVLARCEPSLHSLRPGSQCWVFNGLEVPAAMPTARHMALKRMVTGYMEWQWPQSQSCYTPSRAIHAAAPYTIHYLHPCGPFTVALKAALPPFDRRWRGGALGRSSDSSHMASWGFSFHVGVNVFMVQLPAGEVPPLLPDPPTGARDPVYNDLWTLPHALTRVQFEDMRAEEEHDCDVVPLVPPLSREEVVEVIERDGFEGTTCWERVRGLRWWEIPGADRPAEIPDCPAPCVAPALPAQGGLRLQFMPRGAPPQAHVALWAAGGAVVAWAAFVWFWGTARRRALGRHASQ